MNLKGITQRAVDQVFRLAAQLLRPVVFRKVTGYVQDLATGATATTMASVPVNALVVHYKSSELDGTNVVYGDEKWLVKGSELGGVTPLPSSGDWFEEFGTRFEIQNALLDATGAVWIFQVRRQLFDPHWTVDNSEDWGDLAVHAASEDWGDLGLWDAEVDWMR